MDEHEQADRLRQTLRRAGVDWPTIHRLDDIRFVAGPESDCPNCHEHALLALVDRLTDEVGRLTAKLRDQDRELVGLRESERRRRTVADDARAILGTDDPTLAVARLKEIVRALYEADEALTAVFNAARRINLGDMIVQVDRAIRRCRAAGTKWPQMADAADTVARRMAQGVVGE